MALQLLWDMSRSFVAKMVLSAALVFGSAQSASAVEMAAKVKAYAEKHNLTVREETVELDGRKVKRIFVPVTDASAPDFIAQFTQQDGVVIRQSQADVEHVHMAFGPQEVVRHGALVPHPDTPALAAAQGGLYVALGLNPERKQYLKQTIGENKALVNIGGRNGGCMTWLIHAQVAPNKPLAHELGVKQSMAPSNLIRKLVHAGNEEVVVGVAMSDAAAQPQLMGLRNQVGNYETAIQNARTQIANLEKMVQDPAFVREQQTAQNRVAIQNAKVQIENLEKNRLDVNALRDQQTVGNRNAIQNAKVQIENLEKNKLDVNALRDQQTANNRNSIQNAKLQIENLEKNKLDVNALRDQQTAPNRNAIVAAKAQIENLEKNKPDVNVLRDQQTVGYRNQIATLERQIAQYQVNPAYANHVQGLRNQIAQNQQAIANWKSPYRQQLAQVEQQLLGQENTLKTHGANPQYAASLPQWRAQATSLQKQKEELVATGEAGYNTNWPQIQQLKTQLFANEQAIANWKSPYHQQLANVDQQILNQENTLKTYGAAPQYATSVPQWRQQLTVMQKQKEDLVARGEAGYNTNWPQIQQYKAQIDSNEQAIAAWKSPYHAQLVNLDQQIVNYKNALQQHQNNPSQLQNRVNWQQQLTVVEKQKADFVAKGEAGYNTNWPQIQQLQLQIATNEQVIVNWKSPYQQQLANVDQQILNQENNLKTYAVAPQYAGSLPQWRQQLTVLQKQREDLVAGGEAGYNPNWAQIQQLKGQIGVNEQVIANWKSPYYQQLANIDQQILNQENTIKTHGAMPQYRASVPGWQQQLTLLQNQKAAMIAKGEVGYNPYEPQIQQQRAYIEQQTPALNNLKAQLALAEAAMAKPGTNINDRFTALTSQQLMGAPPGGGAQEAVHNQAAQK